MALTSSYQPIHFTPYQSTTLLKHDFRRQTKRASVVYNEASSFVSSPLFQASRRHLLPCSLDIYAPLPRRCLNMAKSQIFKAALLLLELSLYCVLCVYTVLIVLSGNLCTVVTKNIYAPLCLLYHWHRWYICQWNLPHQWMKLIIAILWKRQNWNHNQIILVIIFIISRE